FGSGLLMFLFPRSCSVFGTEFSSSARARAKARAIRKRYKEFLFEAPRSSVELPFPSGDFNIVIASHILEHVVEDQKFLKEMIRVLKPGGHLILIMPLDARTDDPLSEEELINPDFISKNHFHVRNYNFASLTARCTSLEDAELAFGEADACVW